MNNLRLFVYSSGTTLASDPLDLLSQAEGLRFATGYPGGLYLDCSFYVSMDVTFDHPFKVGRRLVVMNGLKIVYEGWINNVNPILSRTTQGFNVSCIGGWGQYMMRRRWRKNWADNRYMDNVWQIPLTAFAAGDKTLTEIATVNRNNQIKFIPKAVAWANNDYFRVVYTAPTGDTVKRITFDYDLAENTPTNDWLLGIYSETGAAVEWSVVATGTGTVDLTLATPSNKVWLYFQSQDAQTPAADGTIYGKFSNIMVYTETGSINLTEIAKDVRAKLTVLNATDNYIASNAQALVPSIYDNWPTVGDILMDAASFGDASFNPWAVMLKASDLAPTPDGKPVLVVEQYPVTTDYDYTISIQSPNIEGELSWEQDGSEFGNWIIAEYQDEKGWPQYLTPDEDADLTNAVSTTDYGQVDMALSLGYSTLANAELNARRWLAQYGTPRWMMTRPLIVKGYIEAKSGEKIPASQVAAGKRLHIATAAPIGTGLTFIISRTDYDDATQTCTITIGPPPAFYMPQYTRPIRPEEPGEPGEPKKKRGLRRGKFLAAGGTIEQWRAMTPAERHQWWMRYKAGR